MTKKYEIRVNDESYVIIESSNEDKIRIIVESMRQYSDGRFRVIYVTL